LIPTCSAPHRAGQLARRTGLFYVAAILLLQVFVHRLGVKAVGCHSTRGCHWIGYTTRTAPAVITWCVWPCALRGLSHSRGVLQCSRLVAVAWTYWRCDWCLVTAQKTTVMKKKKTHTHTPARLPLSVCFSLSLASLRSLARWVRYSRTSVPCGGAGRGSVRRVRASAAAMQQEATAAAAARPQHRNVMKSATAPPLPCR
jgi:hypothetical protein